MSAEAFAAYARYYDLFYRDKEYAAEAAVVNGLIRSAGVNESTLLDIGCGTGGHVRALALLGWSVTGLDRSKAMIELAKSRTATPARIDYVVGAGAEFELQRQYAAIVSLFHVVSYHSAPGELEALLHNVRRHLSAGGIFVFDFWHGPGVLSDPPMLRTRIFSEGIHQITRISRPNHLPAEHIVEVDYEVTGEPGLGVIRERHRLRYFFMPELAAALAGAGFRLESTRAGVGAEPLSETSWYGLVVARAI